MGGRVHSWERLSDHLAQIAAWAARSVSRPVLFAAETVKRRQEAALHVLPVHRLDLSLRRRAHLLRRLMTVQVETGVGFHISVFFRVGK